MFGNSGHASEIENLLSKQDIKINHYVFKDVGVANSIEEVSEDDLIKMLRNKNISPSAYIGIGENSIRQKLFEKFPTLNYPNLYFDSSLTNINKPIMGAGNVIFESASISVNCKIGSFNHINAFTSISHDFYCENYNTISPGVIIAGKVSIGSNVFVGVGSTIIDKIKICSDVIIGAGSLVIKDIEKPGLYYGSPAKFIKVN